MLPGLSATHKAVAAYVARFEPSTCYVAPARIAFFLGLSPRTVEEALVALVAKGWASHRLEAGLHHYRIAPTAEALARDVAAEEEIGAAVEGWNKARRDADLARQHRRRGVTAADSVTVTAARRVTEEPPPSVTAARRVMSRPPAADVTAAPAQDLRSEHEGEHEAGAPAPDPLPVLQEQGEGSPPPSAASTPAEAPALAEAPPPPAAPSPSVTASSTTSSGGSTPSPAPPARGTTGQLFDEEPQGNAKRGKALDVTRVWEAYVEAWQAHHTGQGGSPPVLDAKRKKLIQDRLAAFSADDLIAAARGVWRSSWNVSEKRTQADIVFRDAEHVERFRDLEHAAARCGPVAAPAPERRAAPPPRDIRPPPPGHGLDLSKPQPARRPPSTSTRTAADAAGNAA